MRRLFPLALLSLVACEKGPDLAGEWLGEAQCGDAAPTLAWFIELEPGAEESTWTGASEFSFDTTDGELILSFGLNVRIPETEETGSIALDVDVVDCEASEGGAFNCWSAEATWDTEDDEINGTFTGVPVNDGVCTFSIERSRQD